MLFLEGHQGRPRAGGTKSSRQSTVLGAQHAELLQRCHCSRSARKKPLGAASRGEAAVPKKSYRTWHDFWSKSERACFAVTEESNGAG